MGATKRSTTLQIYKHSQCLKICQKKVSIKTYLDDRYREVEYVWYEVELYLRVVAGEKVLVGDITLGVVAGDLMGVTGVLTEDLFKYKYYALVKVFKPQKVIYHLRRLVGVR